MINWVSTDFSLGDPSPLALSPSPVIQPHIHSPMEVILPHPHCHQLPCPLWLQGPVWMVQCEWSRVDSP